MKFSKIKKRKFLETWFHKNRETGIISYIYRNPDGRYYYWLVTCFIKRCGLDRCVKNDCNKYVYFNSLENGLMYDSFEECKKAVVEWVRKNI